MLINPESIARYRESRIASKAKSDQGDAQLIADYIREHHRSLRCIRIPKDTINTTYENRSFIQPNYQRRLAMTALDVFGLLPGLSCGKCGQPTCLAFALKFLLDEGSIEQCKPLFIAEYRRLKTITIDFLSAPGYDLQDSAD